MRRQLDLTALRSFVAVADTGGVTRAAGLLNLTQSAVSMQLKRLETQLDADLLDRSQRTIGLTPEGQQLLSYARRILALNDEVFGRMSDPGYDDELVLGVPHDIVYPLIPGILRRFAAAFPTVRINLVSSATLMLKEQFSRGETQVILTTEDALDEGGETLTELPLVWTGAPDGQVWSRRPLRLAMAQQCIFRSGVQRALDEAGIAWEAAVETTSDQTIEACVMADLGVSVSLEGMISSNLIALQHGGTLPALPGKKINLYRTRTDTSDRSSAPLDALADMLRSSYSRLSELDHDFPRRAAVA